MISHLDPPDRAKLIAAYHAMSYIEDGMQVGLGTGSTASWLVKLIGARRVIEGLELTGVSTSETTEALAKRMGIDTATLAQAEWLDLTIDGADEVDSDLVLIKGGGGALLREKIVATASDRMVVIADPTKMVDTLGAYPLPVEVVRFGHEVTATRIRRLLEDLGLPGQRVALRTRGGEPFQSDEGHLILDLHLERIDDPDQLAMELLNVAGVVETGLFLDIAETVVVGASSGEVEILHRDDDSVTVVDIADDERLNEMLAVVDRLERAAE